MQIKEVRIKEKIIAGIKVRTKNEKEMNPLTAPDVQTRAYLTDDVRTVIRQAIDMPRPQAVDMIFVPKLGFLFLIGNF